MQYANKIIVMYKCVLLTSQSWYTQCYQCEGEFIVMEIERTSHSRLWILGAS